MAKKPYLQPIKRAANEILRRTQSKKDLLTFTEYTFPQFEKGPHHRLICDTLQDLANGKNRFCIITLPPRHSKSELVSRRFPAWFLGRFPDKFLITASYGQELSTDFGRDVRSIVGEPSYQHVFPEITIDPSASAADNWRIEHHRGSYMAAGVGTAITGRGAHMFLIDDPFKSREDADSIRERNRVWDWYRAVVFTRLQPKGVICVVCTRWHDDDLVGRILNHAEENGHADQWTVLDLPALAGDEDPLGRQPDEALWPEWYSTQELDLIRRNIGEREFSALYQQRPTPEGGHFFRADWFGRYKALPKTPLKYYAASDFATRQSAGDYTVHMLFAVDPEQNIYVVDLYHAQAESNVWAKKMVDWLEQYPILHWAREKGQILNAVLPFLTPMLREHRVFTTFQDLPSTHDKEVRAKTAQALCERGQVYLPEATRWVGELLAQLTRFPVARHDDMVDALSIFARMYEKVRGPKAAKAKDRQIHARTYTIKELMSKHRASRTGRRTYWDAPIMAEHEPLPANIEDWDAHTTTLN